MEMCREEGVNLQRGMYYHLNNKISVILMSLRPGAPYAASIEEDGRVLIYEGHDSSKNQQTSIPKIIDQPMVNPTGSLTQNGRFYEAAIRYKSGRTKPELVRVYEKIHSGIWVYNGLFWLIDA